MSNIELPAITYTPTIIASNLVQALNTDQSQQAALEQQLSSGLLINSPSDNPSGASSVMYLNSSLSRAQQYVSNANDGLGWLSLGNSTLNSVLSTLQQARQAVVALSGNSLAGNQAAIAGTAAQLQSSLQETISLANTTYGDQAIFAGTGNVSQAYDSSGNYVGAGNAPTRTVAPGVTVPVSVSGDQVFGSGSSGVFGALNTLINDVQTGSTASLQQAGTTDQQTLDSAISNIENQAARLGASYQRMQAFSQQATAAQSALQTQVSSIDSVNVAQATTQLTQDQQTYQTGLWATAQIEEHSLVSYL